jgi:Uma2 family endonuclease
MTWEGFLALPYVTHELVVANLLVTFVDWMRDGDHRGDVCTQQPVKIDDHRGYQFDFAWYPPEHCTPSDEGRGFTGPPALIVEIRTRQGRVLDLVRKRHDYEQVGIGEVWFVDGSRGNHCVLAYQRPAPGQRFVAVEAGVDDHLTSPLLEGFAVRVGQLFERW